MHLDGQIVWHDKRQHLTCAYTRCSAVTIPANFLTLAKGAFMAASVAGIEAARKLREYWVHGAGAAKIAWGTPGDFNRCVSHLGKYVRDPEGLCNEYHQAALGHPPGKGH